VEERLRSDGRDDRAGADAGLEIPFRDELLEDRDDGVARDPEVAREDPRRRQAEARTEPPAEHRLAERPVELGLERHARAPVEREGAEDRRRGGRHGAGIPWNWSHGNV
jgi:hypothetical protein